MYPTRYRLSEEIRFQSEGFQSRAEIASYLRRVADKLNAGDDITLTAGEQSVTMTPLAQPTFEVKAEREGLTDSLAEMSIEFEIEWAEDGGVGNSESGGGLEIE